MPRPIPSMGHVVLLLLLLLYLYADFGYHRFHRIDPESRGSLQASALTLFNILTLEGWVEVQERVIGSYPGAWIYFASFILIAVFVVLNLFVAW